MKQAELIAALKRLEGWHVVAFGGDDPCDVITISLPVYRVEKLLPKHQRPEDGDVILVGNRLPDLNGRQQGVTIRAREVARVEFDGNVAVITGRKGQQCVIRMRRKL